ncbi:hypothetical protein FF1_019916 [Malus domestica]
MASSAAPTPKKIVQSVTVRVPQGMLSPSSSSASSKNFCNRPSNRMHYPSNFKRSAAPARVMFFQNDSWNDLPTPIVEFLRSGFAERKAVVSVEIEGSTVLFDFVRMLQIDLGAGSQRSIAWIDVNARPFFPRAFVSEDLVDGSDSPKVQINKRINVSGRVLGKRQTEERPMDEDEVTSSIRPRSSEWPNVRLVGEAERVCTVCSNLFLAGMKKVDLAAAVTAVHQCVRDGPLDKARLEVFQKQIEITTAARGSANVIYAWCGVSGNDVKGILTDGFGAPSKVSGPQSHGVGLHLSHLSVPFLSAGQSERDDNGEKYAILCRVILGNVEKIEAGSKQCYPSGVEFDNGADDPKNPKWYVIWSTNMNRHVLPECVVSYKSNYVPAQSVRRAYPVDMLISKIKSYLPPSKVQELSSLVCELKGGKLARDDFVKQCRSVTGEQLMASALNDLRLQKQVTPFSYEAGIEVETERVHQSDFGCLTWMAESVLSLCSDVATGVAWFCGSINVDYIRGRRETCAVPQLSSCAHVLERLTGPNPNLFVHLGETDFAAGGGNLSSESSDPNPVDFECAA